MSQAYKYTVGFERRDAKSGWLARQATFDLTFIVIKPKLLRKTESHLLEIVIASKEMKNNDELSESGAFKC